ncbi:MAG: hypothetical protein A4E67_02346 [Syntrophaceae bacterium PtaB.Bin038]|nr:MAG: hypothetical protein A4E67_02346 [Syntrophaceae bacterium PtaB.Bin038]
MRSSGRHPKTASTASLAKMTRRFASPTTACGIASRIEASRASSSWSLRLRSFWAVMSMELPRMALRPLYWTGVTVSRIQRTEPSRVRMRYS